MYMALSHSIKKLFGVSPTASQPDATKEAVSSSELAHINQEMYKKSAELSERNKTLSILQKLNELVLGSITHPEGIAKEVTELLVNDIDFSLASIFLYDKTHVALKRLARTERNDANELQTNLNPTKLMALSQAPKLLNEAVTQPTVLFTNDITQTLFEPPLSPANVKSAFIAPLIVRNELLGAMIIGMKEEKENISEFRRDLLSRLVDTVGIGIDNALLYTEVQDANERLKALDLLKNEFVSVASHELRTPMTAIKSYLWMALQGKGGKLSEKQQYYVERGYNSVDRLIRLVNDMLNISRIESGKISIVLGKVDLLKLTQDVVDEVMPRAMELGVTLKIEKPEALPLVIADSDKIKEVLFNLIGNSLKFTPKGGTVVVKYSQADGMIKTQVVDTGNGIEPQDISKLFQKFGLIAGSYTTNQPAMGTGLGLFICRSIIELHHGKIKAESEGRGKGATFSFTLKILTPADEHLLADKKATDAGKLDLIHTQI